MSKRTAAVSRKTKETAINVTLNLNGSGKTKIQTGIGFFDHVLQSLTKTSLFDIEVQADGDLHVDQHHTIEDVGIVTGQAFAKAVGDRMGILRFGHALLPMDEALVRVALDISGRGFLRFTGEIPVNPSLAFDSQMVEEFFRAFAANARFTLHISILDGKNTHHIIEAVFKAVGLALHHAVKIEPGMQGVLSTK